MSEAQGPAGTFVIAQAGTPAPGTLPAESGVEIAVPPAEAHGGGFPPFDVHTFPSQLVWLAIAFGALYLLMSRIALPRIANILEERHDRIADDLEEAGKLKAESEAAAVAYEKALAGARNKAHGIATETRDKLTADAEASRKSLEAELSAKLAAAEQQIAATKTAAMSNVRGIAVDAAGAIVGELIGTVPAPGAVEAAVDTAIKS
ncbi:F0F1 ATP synthase subunit B [Ancylobacter amanitiformis]|uniref:ATP synthase subunit b n=1 Tax=Ancylobacter amanitiformis TaxID=217069 RepID=A0ABU0LTK0_9HYPH|nr:F0F1 ATP synthase subunit B [Ancylobacter amanitiformis]MDQ0512012.1 F-type H+-transporting ATPase subunit b [Ancylobacter amanitiformis]